MTIETKTVTMNAAFLKEIKEGDVQFGVLLKKVSVACQSTIASQISPQEFGPALAELRDQIAICISP